MKKYLGVLALVWMVGCSQAQAAENMSELSLSQRVNYADPSDLRTFEQRFFWRKDLALGDQAPVFLVLCGEDECTARNLISMQEYAEAFHGHLIALEHRYYGKSQPMPDFSTENLRYLTTDFALKDIEAFIHYAKSNLGLSGKWIIGGYSYPGTLAAYFRQKHPDLVVGALSSSAPVRATDNFYEADRFMAKLAGPACVATIQSVLGSIEESMNESVAFGKIQKQFGLESIENPRDFLYALATLAIAEIVNQPRQFCDQVTSAADPLAAFASFALTLHEGLMGEVALQTATEINQGRQWVYQQCTQFGFLFTANPDRQNSVFSKYLDQSYQQDRCKRTFGESLSLDVRAYNQTYYQPLLDSSTSHILFTNGTSDYWSELSIRAQQAAANPNISTFSIADGIHGLDFGGPALGGAAKDAQDLAMRLIAEWLK